MVADAQATAITVLGADATAQGLAARIVSRDRATRSTPAFDAMLA